MIRVIGLGSPFGDDRAGLRVIQLLSGRLPETIDLVALDRPGGTLVNWMQGVEHLILVDAVSSDANPGSLVRLSVADLCKHTRSLSSHELGLAETLRLAEALGALPTTIEIFGIELGSCRGEALSQAVEKAATALAAYLVRQLESGPVATQPNMSRT